MDFYEVIQKRRSIRGFTSDPIPEAALGRMLEAVRLAPSTCNLQPVKFLLVRSPEQRELVCSCYTRGTWLRQAPLIVVALGNRDQAWKRVDGSSAHVIDATIAMEHLVLAATAEGLATCWICAFDQALLHQKLGLTPEWETVAMTPVGWPQGEPRPFARRERCELVAER